MFDGDRLNIGITCFPTYGGSGVIATEIGLHMARRGHRVHFVCYDVPRRLDRRVDNVFFHSVEVRDYPLFHHSPYSVALASKMVEVATWDDLDILHVHYAVPHATSAYLARQMLGAKAPKVITTLHGTDITLVGSDSSYLPITRFSIEQSDGVTVPSAFLRDETCRRLGVAQPERIEVVPNFVDVDLYAPPARRDPAVMRHLFESSGACDDLPDDALTLVHVSNFRPVKRIDDVVSIFAAVNAAVPARLVLVGDGPERSNAERRLHDLGLHRRAVCLGKQKRFIDVLQHSDVFLLPSETESFGLAALEAQSCGVPVVASDVGGVSEVVTHGETGFLAPCGDVPAMAGHVLALARDRARLEAMRVAARERVLAKFQHGPMLDRYERFYRRVLAQP